ncbi:germination protein YpeB [Terrilactibacillus laevilacticus]|uniref:Germination protein YpeB n=1 Tax=Terrilactibacillus laevilacticus TaxID=1380157 RepID=A0ABW5PRY6_9BACI|nr:germination protein YpeB [Terrilactibacillus laevilacticus]
MFRSILIAILALSVIGFSYWGYEEHKEKNNILIHAENNYQQAYHELAYYIDQLHNQIGSTLAMKTQDSMRPQLADVWRLSTLAHGFIGELPLTLMPFNKTNEFLAKVGEFSYEKGIKETNDKDISDSDYKKLQKLYSQSKEVEDGLREVENVVMTNHLRWMDVELALSSQNQKMDNQVIDGLKTVDAKSADYTKSFEATNPKNAVNQDKTFTNLSGPKINQKEAIERFQSFIDDHNMKVKHIELTGRNGKKDSYTLSMENKSNQKGVSGQVSKQGGHVIWFMKQRETNYDKVTLYEAIQKANKYLNKRKIKNMVLVQSDQYDHVGLLTYALKKENVRIYPASIRIKVALDTGEVIGFDQTDYLYNRTIHVNLKPKLKKQVVIDHLSNKIKVQEVHLVVFQNEQIQNVLCYEILATQDQHSYRILINANTNEQEKVELLNG